MDVIIISHVRAGEAVLGAGRCSVIWSTVAAGVGGATEEPGRQRFPKRSCSNGSWEIHMPRADRDNEAGRVRSPEKTRVDRTVTRGNCTHTCR